jgi:hypothetical protein
MEASEIRKRLEKIHEILQAWSGILHIRAARDLVRALNYDLLQSEKAAGKLTIQLTEAEIRGGMDRLSWAEGLIRQLPNTHDGRNSWLLNYGRCVEARRLQERRRLEWDEATRVALPAEEAR